MALTIGVHSFAKENIIGGIAFSAFWILGIVVLYTIISAIMYKKSGLKKSKISSHRLFGWIVTNICFMPVTYIIMGISGADNWGGIFFIFAFIQGLPFLGLIIAIVLHMSNRRKEKE